MLAAVMAAAVLPMTAFAAEETGAADIWDGTADTGWYDPDDAKESYTLITAEQLAGLARLVNEDVRFTDTTILLDNDLDLSGHEWISIGSGANTPAYAFGGTFDGQGHVINGLYSHESRQNRTQYHPARVVRRCV